MIRFITYSGDNMTISAQKCIASASAYGAERIFIFHVSEISEEFYVNNKKLLDAEFAINYEPSPRPCLGYWLYKPYFIHRVLLDAQDGDILVYADAGVEIISDLNHIVKSMGQDIFLFTNGMQHADWCKASVMQAINGKQIEHEFQQVQASAIFFRVNDFTRKFIKEWLLWCQMPGVIDDSPSDIPNHPEFASHRYDQAVLSCLAYKYGIRTHFWPDAKWFSSQRYRWPGDVYPLTFNHHRKRNEEW